jgi:hypothetical protein
LHQPGQFTNLTADGQTTAYDNSDGNYYQWHIFTLSPSIHLLHVPITILVCPCGNSLKRDPKCCCQAQQQGHRLTVAPSQREQEGRHLVGALPLRRFALYCTTPPPMLQQRTENLNTHAPCCCLDVANRRWAWGGSIDQVGCDPLQPTPSMPPPKHHQRRHGPHRHTQHVAPLSMMRCTRAAQPVTKLAAASPTMHPRAHPQHRTHLNAAQRGAVTTSKRLGSVGPMMPMVKGQHLRGGSTLVAASNARRPGSHAVQQRLSSVCPAPVPGDARVTDMRLLGERAWSEPARAGRSRVLQRTPYPSQPFTDDPLDQRRDARHDAAKNLPAALFDSTLRAGHESVGWAATGYTEPATRRGQLQHRQDSL